MQTCPILRPTGNDNCRSAVRQEQITAAHLFPQKIEGSFCKQFCCKSHENENKFKKTDQSDRYSGTSFYPVAFLLCRMCIQAGSGNAYGKG